MGKLKQEAEELHTCAVCGQTFYPILTGHYQPDLNIWLCSEICYSKAVLEEGVDWP